MNRSNPGTTLNIAPVAPPVTGRPGVRPRARVPRLLGRYLPRQECARGSRGERHNRDRPRLLVQSVQRPQDGCPRSSKVCPARSALARSVDPARESRAAQRCWSQYPGQGWVGLLHSARRTFGLLTVKGRKSKVNVERESPRHAGTKSFSSRSTSSGVKASPLLSRSRMLLMASFAWSLR